MEERKMDTITAIYRDMRIQQTYDPDAAIACGWDNIVKMFIKEHGWDKLPDTDIIEVYISAGELLQEHIDAHRKQTDAPVHMLDDELPYLN